MSLPEGGTYRRTLLEVNWEGLVPTAAKTSVEAVNFCKLLVEIYEAQGLYQGILLICAPSLLAKDALLCQIGI